GLVAAMFALMVMGAFALTPNSASADPVSANAGGVSASAEAFELPAFCAARNVETEDGSNNPADHNEDNAACYGLPTTGQGAAAARFVANENGGPPVSNGPGSIGVCTNGTASTTPAEEGNSRASGTATKSQGCWNSAGVLAIANNDGSPDA